MSLRTTSCAVLLLTVLTSGMPAHAYRMLRPNPATGSNVVEGYKVPCDDNAGFAHRTRVELRWPGGVSGPDGDRGRRGLER